MNKVQSNINLSLEKNGNSDDKEINEKTRDKFKEKIKSGELDDRKIEIMVQKPWKVLYEYILLAVVRFVLKY